MSWMRNPSTWSLVVAVTAIALSQLPPIPTWFALPELRIATRGAISVMHYLGNLELRLFLDLRNTGLKKIEIFQVHCILADEEKKKWLLRADHYESSSHPSSQLPYPSTSPIPVISLQPGSHWAEIVTCARFLNPTEEEQNLELVNKVSADIHEKYRDRVVKSQHTSLIEIDESLIEEATRLFDERFSFEKGEYTLLLAAEGLDGEILSVTGYKFTAYSHHVKFLVAQNEDYKTGSGILHPHHRIPGPTLLPKPMDAVSAKEMFGKVEI